MVILYVIGNLRSIVAVLFKKDETKVKVGKNYQQIPSREGESLEMSETILQPNTSGVVKRGGSRNSSPECSEIEREPAAVRFVDMSKSYGDFTAVDKLNLNLYKDEIFCFLGHNGAGKTTSLNVLIGMI